MLRVEVGRDAAAGGGDVGVLLAHLRVGNRRLLVGGQEVLFVVRHEGLDARVPDFHLARRGAEAGLRELLERVLVAKGLERHHAGLVTTIGAPGVRRDDLAALPAVLLEVLLVLFPRDGVAVAAGVEHDVEVFDAVRPLVVVRAPLHAHLLEDARGDLDVVQRVGRRLDGAHRGALATGRALR